MKKFWALSVFVLFFSACKDTEPSNVAYNKREICRFYAASGQGSSAEMLKYLKCDKKDLVDFLSVFFYEEISGMDQRYSEQKIDKRNKEEKENFMRMSEEQKKEMCSNLMTNNLDNLDAAYRLGCISSEVYFEKLTAAYSSK